MTARYNKALQVKAGVLRAVGWAPSGALGGRCFT